MIFKRKKSCNPQKKKTSNEWPVEKAKFDECIGNNSRVQQSIRVSQIEKKAEAEWRRFLRQQGIGSLERYSFLGHA